MKKHFGGFSSFPNKWPSTLPPNLYLYYCFILRT